MHREKEAIHFRPGSRNEPVPKSMLPFCPVPSLAHAVLRGPRDVVTVEAEGMVLWVAFFASMQWGCTRDEPWCSPWPVYLHFLFCPGSHFLKHFNTPHGAVRDRKIKMLLHKKVHPHRTASVHCHAKVRRSCLARARFLGTKRSCQCRKGTAPSRLCWHRDLTWPYLSIAHASCCHALPPRD